MSLLINDDLIWISVPKCASYSIENALITSDLDIKMYSEYKYSLQKLNKHGHFTKSVLFNEFGIHPTISITRDWLDRWLSALEFVWQYTANNEHTVIIPWEEMDNKFIINTFDTKFENELNSVDLWESIFKKLLKYPDIEINTEYIPAILCVFMSQNYWKENQPCTYEFNIKELHKFEEFIEKRYGVSFKIPHLNSTPKIKNKIEINNELKNHLWNIFEKPFEKRYSLI
jgi:hypothetical protein